MRKRERERERERDVKVKLEATSVIVSHLIQEHRETELPHTVSSQYGVKERGRQRFELCLTIRRRMNKKCNGYPAGCYPQSYFILM